MICKIWLIVLALSVQFAVAKNRVAASPSEREYNRRATAAENSEIEKNCAAAIAEKWNSITKYIELIQRSSATGFENLRGGRPVDKCHSSGDVLAHLADGRLCEIHVLDPQAMYTAYFKAENEVGYDGTPLAGLLYVDGACH